MSEDEEKRLARELHGLCPVCGREHGEDEGICDMCNEVVKRDRLQAYHDLDNNRVIDVCESCGVPPGTRNIREFLKENEMKLGEFEKKYGDYMSPWIFNIPRENR